ncbi:MAG: M20 family peptidase [Armatimonadetes bacterium]|nr:MAG: M20 family peptidase [Armatimonadota bacterium]
MTTSQANSKQEAEKQFLEHEEGIRELSRWMYENPEIAFEEIETSARMVDMLRAGGFDVKAPAYGLETAFEATVGTTGPTVVICAEMDALPEVGHACGHNIIAAAGIGAGIALAPVAEKLGIRVTVLGTPAEEHFGGKVDLINAGAFEGVAAAMMIHPSPVDVVDPVFLAVDHIDVEFFGKASHASSAPHLGVNALDAAVQAYTAVAALRQHTLDSDRIHGIITHGGAAPNIVPDHTTMSWYVRSATDARLNTLVEQVTACFEGAARATGCTFKVSQTGHRYKDLRSDKVLAKLYSDNSRLAGRPMPYFAEVDAETSGSTDMGNVSHEVPAIHPMLSLACDPAVNHQREFAAATLTDKGMETIREGALAMAWTVIDLAEGDLWSQLGDT